MHGRNINLGFGRPLTPVVKKLLIANGVVFLVQQLAGLFAPNMMEMIFGISYKGLVEEFKLWQVFTYMFLHGGWLHVFFNLLALYMFAGELEDLWGSRAFLRYYLISGTGAGLFIALMNYILYVKYSFSPVTIGASGAVYALLLAYGMLWPNREVLLYFLFPVKIKYLLIGFGLMEFFGTLTTATGGGSNISHIGHVGGLITGFIYFKLRMSGPKSVEKKSIKKNEGPIARILKKFRLKRKRKQIDTRIEAKKIIDDLLEKIARQGMGSLTIKEKRMLEWARRHYYPENNDTLH